VHRDGTTEERGVVVEAAEDNSVEDVDDEDAMVGIEGSGSGDDFECPKK
tara:strand:- start:2759 stop:2905 length:147 start_codon:yes stop_codon:yes gene_type:complete